MNLEKNNRQVNLGRIGHPYNPAATLTAAIVAVQLRRSPLKETSLPPLAYFDSKSASPQVCTQVVSRADYARPPEKSPAALFSEVSQMNSESIDLKTNPDWKHPYPPSKRKWKKRKKNYGKN